MEIRDSGGKQRALAVIGAIALVAAAFVVRAFIGGDGDGSGGGSGPTGAAPVVACTPDLESLCDRLVEAGAIAAGTPAMELGSSSARSATFTVPAEDEDSADEEVQIDGWITWDPAPGLANFDAGGPEPWAAEVSVLGTEQLAVVSVDGALAADCSATWACVAERGGKVGVGRPGTSEGIARLAGMAPTFAEDLDPFSLRDRELRAVLDRATIGQSPLARQLSAIMQPGQLDAVIGPRALLEAGAGTPQGTGRGLVVHVPDPEVSISVVLATSARSDRDLSGVADSVRSPDLAAVRASVGMSGAPGTVTSTDLTGFLYQVRQKVT